MRSVVWMKGNGLANYSQRSNSGAPRVPTKPPFAHNFIIAMVVKPLNQSQSPFGRKVEAEATFGNEPRLKGERPLVPLVMSGYVPLFASFMK